MNDLLKNQDNVKNDEYKAFKQKQFREREEKIGGKFNLYEQYVRNNQLKRVLHDEYMANYGELMFDPTVHEEYHRLQNAEEEKEEDDEDKSPKK